jgi:hypothetical protein
MRTSITPHECFVGIINDYENTEMVTLEELKHHIRDTSELIEALKKNVLFKDSIYGARAWTLVDYCDKRKSTDLIRFEHCPTCGKKIDWKAIKMSSTKSTENLGAKSL